jgi:hypothetical protein
MLLINRSSLAILVSAIVSLAHAAGTEYLLQVEQMIRQGKGAQAYDLLKPQQFEQAGNPDFDYLLGLSALEAGHPDAATLAFERVLAVSPNFAAARLDMGRAYFALGDLEGARREFALARELNPPPAARATMDKYEAEIKARESASATRATGYLEAGLGTDGNVTQGPSSSTLFLPAFGVNFTMNTANQKKADDFSQANAGIALTHRLSERLSLYGGVDTKWRDHTKVSNLNYASTDWNAGVQGQAGRDTWRAGVGYNDYILAQQSYRGVTSLGGEFRRAMTDRQQWMLFGQYAEVRYVQAAQVNNNINQWTGGGGLALRMETSSPTLVNVSVYGGQEMEAKASAPRVDGDKDFVGLRAAVQLGLRSNLDLFATAAVQGASYQRSNILYSKKRNDTLYETSAGAVWRLAPAWSLKPQLSWLVNSSNLSVNDYDRYEASVFVRRDF